MERKEVVEIILSNCLGSQVSENVRFGSDSYHLSRISNAVFKQTRVRLRGKDLAGKTVRAVADAIMSKMRPQ